MSSATTSQGRPKTVRELLDHEQLLAMRACRSSARQLGRELLAASGLRDGIRKRPLVAAGAAACLGVLGGPPILRALRSGSVASGGAVAQAGGHSRVLVAAALVALRRLRTSHRENG